jgi:hypothetical protein
MHLSFSGAFLRGRLRFLAIGAAVAILLLSAQASAAPEEGPGFKQLKVSIWPEYDDPRVLVMWELELAEDVALPTTVKYALPAGAQVASACAIDASGQHIPAQVQSTGEGDLVVSYELNERSTHIEFYYNPAIGAERREFTYSLLPLSAADELLVEVQRPLRATEFSLAPAPKATFSDSQGFQYHRYEFGRTEAGQELRFTISYEKPDAIPSMQAAASGGTANAPGNSDYVLPLIVLGLASVFGVLFVFLRSRGRQKPKPRRAAHGGRKAAMRPAVGSPAARFCTGCGEPLRAEAVFCTACGRPARGRGQVASQ